MRESGPAPQDFLERVRSFFTEVLPQRPHYEERPQQQQLGMAVARALVDKEFLLAEAGTGTGKSLAYLIPALLWALETGQPVVISTRTLNLQQQLMEQDLPLLRKLSQEPFRATLARGWSNYVCLRRLRQAESQELETPELGRELAQLADKLDGGAQGVRQKLVVSDALWPLVQADSSACNRQLCPHFQECYLFQERRELERSQLIVANHSLVMADLSLRQEGAGGILPNPYTWILDEGHHLEEVASEHLGIHLSLGGLRRLRQAIYDPKGRSEGGGSLPGLRQRLSSCGLSAVTRSQLLLLLDQGLLAHLPAFYQSGEEFFEWLKQAIGALRVEGRVTLNSDFFHTPEGEECRQAAGFWTAQSQRIAEQAQLLLEQLVSLEVETQTGGQSELKSLVSRLQQQQQQLEFCLFPEDLDWVYWAQAFSEEVELGATPLDIGERLGRDFFAPAQSVIVTSATLAVSGSLNFFARRVGLEDHSHRVTELLLESPFNFQQCAYLGVATDLPDVNHQRFWESSRDSLLWLLEQLEGRSFFLATSYATLQQARRHLEGPLSERGIALHVQGQAPAAELLRRFRENPRSLLLGVDSFWEGVDIPGDDLQCILLSRLPFRVPTDPIVQAHCRRMEEQGQNAFAHYQMPQAILKFRQGFGRLIRSQRDRGLVLVLDSRLYHKSYGAEFLRSLPPCHRRAGRLPGLVRDAIAWMRP